MNDSLTCQDIIDNLGMDILPYIVLLIVPLLGRMSDQAEDVRLVATNCFATLIRYMPLEVSCIHLYIGEKSSRESSRERSLEREL